MKSLTNRLMVVAAAVAAVAGVASAQTMKVEVPFSFQASGAVMPAGTYSIALREGYSSVPIFRLLNSEAKRSALVMPTQAHNKGAGRYTEAKLIFRCADGSCALAQVWTGTPLGAYDLPAPKGARTQAALVEVRAEVKAD